MAYTPFDTEQDSSSVTIDSNSSQTLSANGQEIIDLPSSDFIADANMTKDGHDLVLQAPDGSEIIVEGYFLADPAPVLQSPDGSALTPELVDAFAKAPSEFAQTGTLNDETPVGAIEELSGNATVTRTDGTIESVQIGTPIYQGDVVETSADGAVNIVFIDETSFAISDNARMAIDEYVFDPATESGTQNFSVLRGVFVFTSGLIGRDDPDDVEIDTPVGSIGIRGTIIAGDIQPGGESEITVIEGAIVVRNGTGEETLSAQFETVKLNGYDSGIEKSGVMQAEDVGKNYGAVKSVSPTLFSSIDDAAQEQSSQGNDNTDSSEPQASQENVEGEASDNAEPDQQPDLEAAPSENQPQPDVGADPVGKQGMFDGQNDSFAGENQAIGANSGPSAGQNLQGAGSTAGSYASGQNAPDEIAGGSNNTAGDIDPPPTPPFALDLEQFDLPVGNFNAGFVVGVINTTNTFGQVDFSLNGGGGNVELVTLPSGYGAVIKLTALGATNLAGLGPGAGFNYNVTAIRNGVEIRTLDANASIFDPTVVTAPDSLNLDALSAGEGYIIQDDLAGGQRIGNTISALGDVDGDGFEDFAFTNDIAGQNHVFVVSGGGNAGGLITSNPGQIDVVTIGGANNTNSQVTGIGDYNGDGINDFAVSQPNAGTADGRVVIIDGSNNNIIHTETGSTGNLGFSISSIGDINNDGYQDLITGSPASNEAFLITFDGTTTTSTAVGTGGINVSGAGDYNGDGLSDFVISDPSGAIKVYFGGGAYTAADVTFNLGGPASDIPVSTLGDFNGDGRSDLLIGDVAGDTAHIIYGGSTGGNLAVQSQTQITADTGAGWSLSSGGSVGDFNGDGLDDAVLLFQNGNDVEGYVVYGGLTAGDYTQTDLRNDPSLGLKLNYDAKGGTNLTVSGVGDIDGDGFDDFAIGNSGANSDQGEVVVVNGLNTGAVQSGLTASDNGSSLVGGAGAQTLSDGGNDDVSMRGGRGDDVFRISHRDGGDDASFVNIDGGKGYDYLSVQGGDLDFRGVNFEQISGVEEIRAQAVGQTITLSMENIFNMLKTTDTDNGGNDLGLYLTSGGFGGITFEIEGSGGTSTTEGDLNTNNITDDAEALATGLGAAASDAGTFDKIEIGGYNLYISEDVTVNLI